MEILSDTIFRGNVEIAGHNKLIVSEFELGNNIIRFYGTDGGNTEVYLQPGTMATTDQIDNINSNIKNITLGNHEIPANCTRFYFYRGEYNIVGGELIPKISDYPIINVYSIPHDENDTFKLIQIDVDFKNNGGNWTFIGNIADHSDVIGPTEFVLSIKR